MGKYVSDELRRALNDPKTRYRLVDAWVLTQRVQALEAAKAEREAARRPRRPRPAAPSTEG